MRVLDVRSLLAGPLPVLWCLAYVAIPTCLGDTAGAAGQQSPAAVAQVLEDRVSQVPVDQRAQEEILTLARQVEQHACNSSDEAEEYYLRMLALRGYLTASLPRNATPFDDPSRQVARAGWGEYVNLAWRLASASEGGIDDVSAASLLAPSPLFDSISEEGWDVRPLYGRAFIAPAMELMDRTNDDLVKVRAGVFVVRVAALVDWGLASDTSNEIYDIDRQAQGCSRAAASGLAHAIAEMRDRLSQALWILENDIAAALDLYFGERETYPAEPSLRSGEHLWDVLHPYLSAAISERSQVRRVAEWVDLATNPLLTTPGLRIVDVAWIEGDSGNAKPYIHFRHVFWEGWHRGRSESPPWMQRYSARLAMLEAVDVRAEDGTEPPDSRVRDVRRPK